MIFVALGALQCYDLICEQFEYSGEDLNTGVDAIDSLEAKYTVVADADDGVTYDANNNVIIDANTGRPYGVASDWQPDDVFNDGGTFETEADGFIDFSEADPFSDDGRY